MSITKKASLDQIISDFVHSDNPKFADKTKEERIKMAQGAYYSMKNEGVESIIPLLTSIIAEDKEALKEGMSKALLEKISAKLEEKKQQVMEEMFGEKS